MFTVNIEERENVGLDNDVVVNNTWNGNVGKKLTVTTYNACNQMSRTGDGYYVSSEAVLSKWNKKSMLSI